jgi:SAM-dependent methyltransferase
MSIKEQLKELKIIDEQHVTDYFPHVRDSKDISVLRCNKSGVIFLSSGDHINKSYYGEKKEVTYWTKEEQREKALRHTYEDDHRRFLQIRALATNKSYIDIGTGMGGVLDFIKPFTKDITAVEPIKLFRDLLTDLKYDVYEDVTLLPEGKKYEVVTLFHVFEHLTDPLQMLKEIYDRMANGGKLIIEVPHARDILITTYESEAFKNFTFWSEHLILHTRESLSTYLQTAGFTNVTVSGYQRYPLANHLYWLNKKLPGGHVHYSQLRSADVEKAYSNLLCSIDQTDTIIAIAEKP